MNLSDDIKQKAIELGFDLVGITDASPIGPAQTEMLKNFLNSGRAADMLYLHKNFEKRTNPAKLLKNAKSVICVALNYKPEKTNKKSHQKTTPTGKVADYACYQDYHRFIKKLLHKLADYISANVKEKIKVKICVDSAPLAERALAARAGLGFIGKNHSLINPKFGPQLLLGEILTDIELQPDRPLTNHCPDCNKCVTACPTAALSPAGRFDANKCISYLTIEHKKEIPPHLTAKIADHLFGCDECILACPYSLNAPPCTNKQFEFHPETKNLDLNQILKLSPTQFEAKYTDSPIKRPGLQKLKQNAKICIKNITA